MAKILYVEDDELQQELIREYLGREGHEVTATGGGRRALAVYNKNWVEIDLVLLDLGLLEMSGSQLFHEMKETNPQVKVLVVTGDRGPAVEALLNAGVLGVLYKPFRVEELMLRVGHALNL